MPSRQREGMHLPFQRDILTPGLDKQTKDWYTKKAE